MICNFKKFVEQEKNESKHVVSERDPLPEI